MKFGAIGNFHNLFFDKGGKVELNFRERPSAIQFLVKLGRGRGAAQLAHLRDDRRLCLLDVGPGVKAQATPGPTNPIRPRPSGGFLLCRHTPPNCWESGSALLLDGSVV
jgi:hypothetical protein